MKRILYHDQTAFNPGRKVSSRLAKSVNVTEYEENKKLQYHINRSRKSI